MFSKTSRCFATLVFGPEKQVFHMQKLSSWAQTDSSDVLCLNIGLAVWSVPCFKNQKNAIECGTCWVHAPGKNLEPIFTLA